MCEIPGSILIVDDDPQHVALLSHILSREFDQLTIMTAVSYEAAGPLIKQNSFDLIVSDYLLDSGKTADDLRNEDPHDHRWIFMTASNILVDGKHDEVDVVQKPVDTMVLNDAVEAVLVVARLQRTFQETENRINALELALENG